MRILENPKSLITFLVTLTLALALIRNATAQSSSEMQTFFSKDYPGISIQVNGTRQADPGENITVGLWINCTADDVYVDYLNISFYGYRHFRYGLEKTTLNFACMMNNSLLGYHNASEQDYTMPIPNDVWDLTYAEIRLKYSIKASSPTEYDEIFPITTMRNVLWEELEKKLEWWNETHQLLNTTYWQLNSTYELLDQTFWESFQMNLSTENLAYLNKTYWELQHNYTALQGSLNELDNTRSAVAALAITTVIFVATTIYMIMRKPKQYW